MQGFSFCLVGMVNTHTSVPTGDQTMSNLTMDNGFNHLYQTLQTYNYVNPGSLLGMENLNGYLSPTPNEDQVFPPCLCAKLIFFYSFNKNICRFIKLISKLIFFEIIINKIIK